jgi:hypothetical protein
MLHWLGLLVPDRLSISRAVSIKSDPMEPTGLPSVKCNLLLGRSAMNDQVGVADLRFYWGI